MKDQPQHTTAPVPPVPPPTPQQSSRNNATSLLSPWWSAEQQQQQQQQQQQESDKARHLLIHFTRIVNGTAQEGRAPLFTEQCVLLTRHDPSNRNTNNMTTPSISDLSPQNHQAATAPSSCRMVCLLRENEERREAHQQARPSFFGNPFHGLWVVVAKNQTRCLEHSAEKDIVKKNHDDYYTIHLGERLSGSGGDVKRMVTKTFGPMQELTRRYIKSWQDGTQSVFLSRFWESAMRGDGLVLLRDSTKKLFKVAEPGDGGDSTSSNNKKNSDKDNSSRRSS